jgi:hypothetical protein
MRPALPLLFALMPLMGAALPPDAVRPGYWETTNKVLSPLPSSKTENRCVSAKEVARFMLGPSNHIYTCTYPSQTAAGGRISFSGHCESRKGRQVEISGQGDYSPTTLHLIVSFKTSMGILPVSGKASTDARRIGDVCPPAAVGAQH